MTLRAFTLLYLTLGIIGLSGFGILFLNEESILALCFFIFFYLILQHSSGATSALDEQIRSYHTLLAVLIKGQKKAKNAKVLIIHRNIELTLGLEKLYLALDSKINKNYNNSVKTIFNI